MNEKIAKPLIPVIAKEGFRLTKTQVKSKAVAGRLAELIANTTDTTFCLDIYDDTEENIVCELYCRNYSEQITIRPTDSGKGLYLCHYDDSISIPRGIPSYLHQLVLALITNWL